MKVCIVGAGNIGLAMAGVMASRGNEVVVYTKKELDPEGLELHDVENGRVYSSLGVTYESRMEIALSGKDYIFCTYPAFLRASFIAEAEPFVGRGCRLGFIPGYGGAEYMCRSMVENGVEVFGFQRVPFVARQENGRIANILSRKSMLYVASIPKASLSEICSDMESLIGIPVTELNEYLAVTLAPSNPLLHLTGLYNVFKDYQRGDSFDRQLMFYEEWNDETSELLLRYDDELQEICNRIPLDLEEVVPLRTYYESPTAEEMTRKLKSIKAFEVVQVPLVEDGGRFYPDWNSRMFIEDFPFGIAIIKYLALLTEVATPAIDLILGFYQEKTGVCYFQADGCPGKDFPRSGVPANFGLDTLEKIVSFYR